MARLPMPEKDEAEMARHQRYARLALADGRRVFVEVEDDVAHVLDAAPWSGGSRSGERITVAPGLARGEGGAGPTLCAPVVPSKILCVGRNYHAHAKELGNEVPAEPMIFYKPPSSIIDPGESIELPPTSIATRIDHEAELGVVIGKRLRRASVDEAREAIFGLTLVCDVTARDLQKKDGQWWRAKGMDTFCPVGPSIVRGLDPQALAIRCHVGTDERQSGHTSNMIFSVVDVIRHITQVVTLEPGDLIVTGTPEGVGPLAHGDVLTIDIEEIGTLRANVVAS